MPFPEAVAITGGAGDRGAAIRTELAATGARVRLIGRNAEDEVKP